MCSLNIYRRPQNTVNFQVVRLLKSQKYGTGHIYDFVMHVCI